MANSQGNAGMSTQRKVAAFVVYGFFALIWLLASCDGSSSDGQGRNGMFDDTQDSGMIVACSEHLGNGAWGADMDMSSVISLGGSVYSVDVYDDGGSFVGSCEVESDDAEDVYRVR